jgi:very-short-patch-repair endonuclease
MMIDMEKNNGIRQLQRRNSSYIRDLIKGATKQELIVKKYLEYIGVRAMFQKGFLKPLHRILVFYMPRNGLIIEIDGGCNINCSANHKLKDKVRGDFKTLKIKNKQVDDGSFKDILDKYLSPL